MNRNADRRDYGVEDDVVTTFLRWTFLRAILHRGYVLTSGLYFVAVAHLSVSQLVFLGTVMAVTLGLTDIPAGVLSDTISRKWPLVIGHGFLAAGMALTGLVTAFPLIMLTQVLWGLGWAFSGGADVAWLTDELNQPGRIARVLTTRARWELTGGATGMVAFGVLGWATSLATAVIVSGAAMALLGLFVAVRFVERNFTPASAQRWRVSRSIFQRGLAVTRRDHVIRLMFCATLIINGAGVIAWLFPKQLILLGFPRGLVLWYTALGILSSAAGYLALHIVEARIGGRGVAPRIYALSCFIGVLGLVVLTAAPDAIAGGIGVLLVSGIAFTVTRAVSIIWVNERTTSDLRATIHSFLSQAETIGEILGGFMLAAIAQTAGMSSALIASAALFACAGVMVGRHATRRDTN